MIRIQLKTFDTDVSNKKLHLNKLIYFCNHSFKINWETLHQFEELAQKIILDVVEKL